MSSKRDLVDKYYKYKNKYKKIKSYRLKEGKYYIDKITNPDIDVLYKNKELLYSVRSKFQDIQVYDHNFFGHILVIDDDLQLTEYDERTYHEMIVHVPMNYLENAKKVLIIGGGDCGSLTEVCKHPNVDEVIMIEIDEEVVNIAEKYFNHLTTGLQDRRTKLIIDDGYKWIKRNLEKYRDYFDVIIVDSTDYTTALSLFTDDFYKKISEILNKNGVFSFNCMSISWMEIDINDVYKQMGLFFKHVDLYQAFIPTYASGHYAFCFCSNSIDPRNTPVNFETFNKKKIECQYYNSNIHTSSFFLPNEYERNNLICKERLGSTLMIDVKNVKYRKLNDMDIIKKLFDLICEYYKLTVVSVSEKQFEHHGLTLIYTLSESHLSIHTWPERGKCCIDLFTCGKFRWYFNGNDNLTKLLSIYFEIPDSNIKVNSLEREI